MKSFFTFVGWSFCILVVLGAGEGKAADLGPLQTANRLPLYLMFLTPQPTKAQLPAHGELETSLAVEYNSIFLKHSGSRWDVLMDMEMMIVDISLVYGVGTKMALKVDLPLVSMGDGFLDGSLESYHDALGVPNCGREDRPGNTFGYHIFRDGAPWVQGRAGTLNPADITISTQIELASTTVGRRAMTSALLLSLKLPTGNEEIGLGSGEVDAGLFVPIQWSGLPYSFYLMPGITMIKDPESRQVPVSGRNSLSLFAGTAYDYNDRLRLLAQLNFHTSPIESTGSSRVDNGALELSLGFQRRLRDRLTLEFAFSEDLTRAAPDFNMRLGIVWSTSVGGIRRDEQ